jgi:dUTP pyrophosphatase
MRRLIGRIIEWFLSYPHTVVVQLDSYGSTGQVPREGYPGDAGYDLYCSQDIKIPAHGYMNIPSTVRFQMPIGIWLMIKGRSSSLKRLGIIITDSVIDNGYRGEMFIQSYNPTNLPVNISHGDRIGQVVPFRLIPLRFMKGKVNATVRGERGFGSSGE